MGGGRGAGDGEGDEWQCLEDKMVQILVTEERRGSPRASVWIIMEWPEVHKVDVGFGI